MRWAHVRLVIAAWVALSYGSQDFPPRSFGLAGGTPKTFRQQAVVAVDEEGHVEDLRNTEEADAPRKPNINEPHHDHLTAQVTSHADIVWTHDSESKTQADDDVMTYKDGHLRSGLESKREQVEPQSESNVITYGRSLIRTASQPEVTAVKVEHGRQGMSFDNFMKHFTGAATIRVETIAAVVVGINCLLVTLVCCAVQLFFSGRQAVERPVVAEDGEKLLPDHDPDGKVSDSDDTPFLEPWMRQSFESATVGILVSDMSGFTRLTREYGTIHFASLIIRMRQICLPILHHYNASFITTEADDLIAMFPTASDAVLAAHGMQRTVAKYNASLPEFHDHFAITLNGVGVDYGPGPLVSHHNKLFGRTFTNAYSLGEDLCKSGQVLITGHVLEALWAAIGEGTLPQATWERAHHLDAEKVCQNADGVYVLKFEELDDFPVPSFDDDQYLHQDLMCLARRHDFSLSQDSLATLDEEITSHHCVQRTALMIAFACYDGRRAFAIEVDDPEEEIRLQHECLTKIRKVVEKYDGRELEEELFVFLNSVHAVKAAMEMREVLELHNSRERRLGNAFASVRGYGIHQGDILCFPNTDVHWGDPVNTSSKMGQDLAKDGELLISARVFEAVCTDPQVIKLKVEEVELDCSNVLLDCYRVARKGEESY